MSRADFTLWDRATLEQFAKEATEKMVADWAAIDELVGALKDCVCVAEKSFDDEGSEADEEVFHITYWKAFQSARAAITKHTQPKEQA